MVRRGTNANRDSEQIRKEKTMEEETALAIGEQALALTPAVVVAQAAEQAKLLMDIVEQTGCSTEIEGKKYLEVEAWEVIGAFNRVHAITEHVETIKEGENTTGYLATVGLYKDGELISRATMSCGFDEFPCRGKEGMGKDKAAQSAAQTWAESKAYRMNFSYIAKLAGYQPTPAEEMLTAHQDAAKPKARHGICPVHDIPWTQFKNKEGNKWLAHRLPDGSGYCNKTKLDRAMQEESKVVDAEMDIAPPPAKEQEAPPEFKNLGALYDYCNKTWKMMPKDIAVELNIELKRLPTVLDSLEAIEGAWQAIKAVRG